MASQTSIFVSGLPYTASEETVRSFFAECGQIIELKLPRYQDTNRLIGYAHIVFDTKEAAQLALKKNKSYMENRYLDVQLSRGENSKTSVRTDAPPENCRTVFVKGFPYSINEDELGDAFRSCGEILNVRIVYNSINKNSKGFGYIEFKHFESVKKAIELSDKVVLGRKIFVDYEVSKPRQGYKLKMDTEGNEKYAKEQKTILKKKIKKDKKEEQKYVKIKDVTGKKHENKEKKFSLF